MKILKIIPDTIVDGPRLRTSIYVAGCKWFCSGCHNKSSWSFDAGTEMSIPEILEKVVNPRVTISGGDPSFSIPQCIELMKALKTNGVTDIWVYTGFTLDQLQSSEKPEVKEYLELIDGLVDGLYQEKLRDPELLFRGSSNQVIWVKDQDGKFIKSELNDKR